MRRTRGIVAALGGIAWVVFPLAALAADSSLSKQVSAGLHEPKTSPTDFDKRVCANKAASVDATVASATTMKRASVAPSDIEMSWNAPTSRSNTTNAVFTGTFTPDAFKDGGYFSHFDGEMKAGPGPGAGDPTWDFYGRLRVLRIEIEVNNTADENDDIVCRYSTNPAGRPTVPCRARIQGLPSGNQTVVLANQTGAGELRFPAATDTTRTLQLPATGAWVLFEISGQTESTNMNDAVIEARVDTATGIVCGEEDVTVLWVSIGGKFSAGSSMDGDNSARFTWSSGTEGVNKGKTGPVITAAPLARGIAYGVELKGVVHPTDFILPTGRFLWLDRDIRRRVIIQRRPGGPDSTLTDQSPARGGVVGNVAGVGNDWRTIFLKDGDPRDGSGYIFDIDGPGFRRDTSSARNAPTGTYHFSRQSFYEFAWFGPAENGIRCSNDYPWFARTTGRKTGGVGDQTWVPEGRPGIGGDNQAGTGETYYTVDPPTP